MSMTIVVTRNVPARVRGFLASVMCEIAPGVYTAPRMSRAVRERVWTVLEGWLSELVDDRGVVMTWPDRARSGGQEIRTLGGPPYHLVEVDGVFVARSDLTVAERAALELEDPTVPF